MPPDTPLILAFDTAAAHCAAALLSGDRVLASETCPMKTGQAEHLMPMLDQILQDNNCSWNDLSAIAVGVGPGNFTGIRLGVAAARGLSLALGIPAIGISALQMCAPETGAVTVALPSGKTRYFVQHFRDSLAVSAPELVDSLVASDGFDLLTNPEIDPVRMARIAASRLHLPHAAPAPIYLRAADAAPSSDIAPTLLDAD